MPATILLVDSDLIDRADWQALLQFHGYKVHSATNGRTALECFPSLQPDLVLMDSVLIDISSDEVCRRMKADPLIGDTPIVVVDSTTRDEVLDRIHALLAGGQFHLFDELSEEVYGCPICCKRPNGTGSIEFDG